MHGYLHRFVRLTALLCAALTLWSCAPSEQEQRVLEQAGITSVSVDEVLDAQLGVLIWHISPAERARARKLLADLMPLKQRRLVRGEAEPGAKESGLLEELNELYEKYTVKYLDGYGGGDEGWGWSWDGPEATYYATFTVNSQSGELSGAMQNGLRRKGADISAELEEYGYIWQDVRAILPKEALRRFSLFTVWTDGPGETLAYVQAADDTGATWEIAIDPADLDDGILFLETVLHEYSHSLTLCDDQVTYGEKRGALTYSEPYMTTRQNSYLNAFYRRFWSLTLDDRTANPQTYNFYLRHKRDFVSDYASTDPSEDIAESFTAFVLLERPEKPTTVADEKILFFYDYDELATLRDAIRENLDWEAVLDGTWSSPNS